MFNKQLKQNVKELDVRIGKLYADLDKAKTQDERKELLDQAKELADHRNTLSESKTRESLAPIVIPGVIGLTAMFMVIRHEETNIITTKALSLATRMFKGH